jgi:hypothetical protein
MNRIDAGQAILLVASGSRVNVAATRAGRKPGLTGLSQEVIARDGTVPRYHA